MWKARIEQYFQVIEQYFQVIENGNTFNALWEVIENGNSFKPVPRTTTNADGTSTSTILGHVTAEEKAQKKNDLKARSMLLMALPNEHLLTFSQYKDAKTLFEAIQARFGGNDATKKTQKTLLKQMYENFNSPSIESLDSIFNRLQKIVKSVGHPRNKPDLDTMSFDDLHNNFKIVKQEVKRTVTTSSSSGSQNMAFISTPGIYAFLANHPNRSQLVHEDLEQIHEDDLEEMDLKWECRGLRNQESRPRNQDNLRKTVHVEETSSKAMIAIDGAGFDWSFMADEEAPTNMALMAFSDLEVLNDKTCSNTCLKAYETLKTQHDNLRIELNKSEFDLATYKRGLASVEEQLVFYKKNEVMFCDKIDVLERDITYNDADISVIAPQSIINPTQGDPQVYLKDTGIFDSGCSKHMTRNKSYLTNYQDYDRGFVAFAGSSKGGKITGKCKIRTGKLYFEDVYFVKELKFNLFSVSQMCDRKNSLLFTETECLILSSDFKLPDKSQVMLKIPRKDNMYSFNLKNIVPSKGLTCLFTKATNDESKMWHRRLGHRNFKTMNKLVKGNLVRGLPLKIFEDDHTCVAC
ncbi:ribonuclease H-like domain-containing protein [Tanacetum coccineum]